MAAPSPLKKLARRLTGDDDLIREFRSSLYKAEATIADLEQRALKTRSGWRQLTASGESSFSREALGDIVAEARAAAIKNPLTIRGLNLRALFVFGQGVTIKAVSDGDQERLDAFLDDERNQRALTGHAGRMAAQTEADVTGNVFVAMAATTDTGAPLRVPQVRLIPLEQIDHIIRNPNDADEPWYYRRRRNVESFDPQRPGGVNTAAETVEYHPSLALWRAARGGRASNAPKTIEGKPVVWNVPIRHRRVGGYSHWPFGLPIVYAAMDWAMAHTTFLSDWRAFVAALSKHAAQLTNPRATPDQIAAAKAQIEADAGRPGGVFVAGGDWKIEPLKATGAAISVQDAKAYRLQIAAALGVPDHILSGDAEQGSLATAQALNRPMEIAFRAEQQAWGDLYHEVCSWALRAMAGRALEDGLSLVSIEWPPIMEHQPREAVEALARALSAPLAPELAGAEREARGALLNAAGYADAWQILDAATGLDGPLPGIEPESARLVARLLREIQTWRSESQGR
jgi:hypothetical protein